LAGLRSSLTVVSRKHILFQLGVYMVRDIVRAKDAQDINELTTWVKKGKSRGEKTQRFKEASTIDFYWSSFKTDEELRSLETALEL
jgi:hypothetical protein